MLACKRFANQAARVFSFLPFPFCFWLLFWFFSFPDKLDGIRPMKSKRKREESPPLHLSDDDDPYDEREEDMRIGKKRVGDVSCYQVFKESRIYRMMLDKGCLSSVLVFNIIYDMCACSLSISVPLLGLLPLKFFRCCFQTSRPFLMLHPVLFIRLVPTRNNVELCPTIQI